MRRPLDNGQIGRDQRGTALLELALVLPVLVLILYGIVSFGVVLAAQHTLTEAASDGARAAVPVPQSATPGPSTVAEAQADDTLGWLGQCDQSGITCTTALAPCGGAVSSSTCLTLTITYDYTDHPLVPLLPGLNLVMPSTLTSSTTTLMAAQSS